MTTAEAEILYARQPIYDRSQAIVGFELLFRGQTQTHTAPKLFDGDVATSRVLINAFSETHANSLSGDQPLYINFTAETLISDLPFPPHRLVVEVLESVEPTPRIIESLAALRRQGYRIALDDYNGFGETNVILAYADIIKVDYPQYSPETFVQAITKLRENYPEATILAEKVETHADFVACRDIGCDLFQGYFLSRPELVHGHPLPVDRIRVMELLAAINDPRKEIESIAEIIRHDAFLSLRLLKLANSAYYYQIGEVSSLTDAIMALGTIRIRAFASLLALSKLEKKPRALHYLAASRAFICQRLAEELAPGPEMGFTVGLFSCLDAFFDQSLADILDSVPFDRQIAAAVLNHEGTLGLILKAVITHEQGRLADMPWAELRDEGIDADGFMEAFHGGIERANRDYFTNEAVA